MLFPNVLPREKLPKNGTDLANDLLVSKATGIPCSTVSRYRREGVLPPYDVSIPGTGHGGWYWSTIGDFVNRLRMGKYGGDRVRRGTLVREAIATARWPNGWGQQSGDAA